MNVEYRIEQQIGKTDWIVKSNGHDSPHRVFRTSNQAMSWVKKRKERDRGIKKVRKKMISPKKMRQRQLRDEERYLERIGI